MEIDTHTVIPQLIRHPIYEFFEIRANVRPIFSPGDGRNDVCVCVFVGLTTTHTTNIVPLEPAS